MLHARLTNLGFNYMEVLYLMEFLNRNNIVYTHDFYKICKFKIRDTDRDEYSMKKKETCKYNDIYHDRNLKHELTIMFLRTLVGLYNFATIDFRHWFEIKNNKNYYLQTYYDRVMKRFWADKVLSAPVKKKLSSRLRKIAYIDSRERIFENLVSVWYAKRKILRSFFFGNVLEISFPDFKQNISIKTYKWNIFEFQKPLMAKIVDHGELKQFKRQILHLQAELNQDIQDKINFRIYIKNRQRAAINNRNEESTINNQQTASANKNQDLPKSKRFKRF